MFQKERHCSVIKFVSDSNPCCTVKAFWVYRNLLREIHVWCLVLFSQTLGVWRKGVGWSCNGRKWYLVSFLMKSGAGAPQFKKKDNCTSRLWKIHVRWFKGHVALWTYDASAKWVIFCFLLSGSLRCHPLIWFVSCLGILSSTIMSDMQIHLMTAFCFCPVSRVEQSSNYVADFKEKMFAWEYLVRICWAICSWLRSIHRSI
jgi:hypothetical protein